MIQATSTQTQRLPSIIEESEFEQESEIPADIQEHINEAVYDSLGG
jgi:hypothetical protein